MRVCMCVRAGCPRSPPPPDTSRTGPGGSGLRSQPLRRAGQGRARLPTCLPRGTAPGGFGARTRSPPPPAQAYTPRACEGARGLGAACMRALGRVGVGRRAGARPAPAPPRPGAGRKTCGGGGAGVTGFHGGPARGPGFPGAVTPMTAAPEAGLGCDDISPCVSGAARAGAGPEERKAPGPGGPAWPRPRAVRRWLPFHRCGH